MLNAKLKPIESSDERAAPRYRLLLQASAGTPETGVNDIVIHDLSATGFLIECQEALATGAELGLDLPGASLVTGDIVWSSGNFYGGEFRAPLTADILAQARSSSPVLWPDFVPKSAANRSAEESTAELQAAVGSPDVATDERLPIAQRTLIITGASILLWTPIALGIWSAVS